jgi:hypothetical protein
MQVRYQTAPTAPKGATLPFVTCFFRRQIYDSLRSFAFASGFGEATSPNAI